eukprot:4349831-Prymnesium_polylepis.1
MARALPNTARTPSPIWQVWPYISPDQQREVAPLLAAAQWHCQQWDAMRRIVGLIGASLPLARTTRGWWRSAATTHGPLLCSAQS